MITRRILDADMHMVGRTLQQGWRWWRDEMRALIPPRLRRSKARASLLLAYGGGALSPLPVIDGRSRATPKAGARATIVVPRALCLSRVVTRPVLNDRDLRRMVALEADTLLPLPAGSVVIAVRSTTVSNAPGASIVEVAGLPLDGAQAVTAAILAAGVVAVRIVLQDTQHDRTPLDFAPAIRDLGLLPRIRSATPLVWGMVGLLACLDLAGVILRDVESVDRLEARLQDQQPAVTIARTIARRSAQDRALVARSVMLRNGHNILGALQTVGDALPAGVWLQRLVWDGSTVRLVGYRPAKIDVASALRKSGSFTAVEMLADDTQAAMPVGEPFDITARIAAK